MKSGKLFYILILFFITVSQAALSDTGVNSPYSRYGLGLMGDGSASLNKPLGGTGVGIRMSNSINVLNPASYSSVDTLTFLLDAGFTLQNGNFSENGVKVNARNTSFDYVAMQFRVAPTAGMTVALLPYSNVGYKFSNREDIRIEDNDYVSSTNTYSGNGGLRQVVLGLGWSPAKFLAVGVNGYYYFGEIEHQILNTYSSSALSSSAQSSSSTIYPSKRVYSVQTRAFSFDAGLQFSIPFKNESALVIGAKYQPKMSVNGTEYIYNVTYDVSDDRVIVSDTTGIDNAFSLAEKFSAGVSFESRKLLFATDFSLGRWSNAKFFNKTGRDNMRMSFGAMYTPDPVNKKFFLHSSYSVGCYYQSSYFTMNGKEGPREIGVSVGIKFPLFNSFSSVAVSGQYANVKMKSGGGITENYFRLNIGLTFNDSWFAKWQVQ